MARTKSIQKAERESLNIKDKLLDTLKVSTPEVFAEGKVDWDKLRRALGEHLETSSNKFNFTWAGKAQAITNVLIPSKGTLRPDKKESVKFDTSENFFIEGDNLEVLKLLQKSYFEQVKMIYIDPPYNDGKDRVYKDDYRNPLKNYLEQSGQIDSEGNHLYTNTQASGRFHSDWLTMLYPRLKLAWNLLRHDGVIFISIDEKEAHHLRLMMDEIFGEENCEGVICWRRRYNQPNDKTKMIAKVAEFIIAYAKDSKALRDAGVGKVGLTGEFSNPDNDSRGDWASKPWKVGSGQSGSRYKITAPNGKVFDEEWMGDETTYKKLLADKRIIFPKKGDGFPRKKYFRSEREQEGQCATNWWPDDIFGHNQGASDMLAEIFGQKNVFDNPKPIELIQGLIQIANVKDNDIVVDFFAGSGTTAHALFEENQNEDIRAKFIIVQFPEQLDSANKDQKEAYNFCVSIKKPANIAEICKERIRRVLKGYGDHKPIDSGFKVFKLDKSNYYDNLFEYDPEKSDEENEKAFKDYLNKAQKELFPAKINEMDIVYENIIKEGLSLNAKIDEIKIAKNKVYKVADGERELLICLDEKLTDGIIDALTAKEYKEKIFICFDGALTDSEKANLALNLTLKTI